LHFTSQRWWPQIFSRDLLERAHAASPGVTATDDAQLVEAVGGTVHLVETSPANMKVTVPMDFEIAKMLLKKGR
jgi:2-C-methyl-D-erythritol 4-phosphate cytidylyltransferase